MKNLVWILAAFLWMPFCILFKYLQQFLNPILFWVLWIAFCLCYGAAIAIVHHQVKRWWGSPKE